MPLFKNESKGEALTSTTSSSVETEETAVTTQQTDLPPLPVRDTQTGLPVRDTQTGAAIEPDEQDTTWLGISSSDATLPFINVGTQSAGHWVDTAIGKDYGNELRAGVVAVMPVWVETQPRYLTEEDAAAGRENPNAGKTAMRYRDGETPEIKEVKTADGYKTTINAETGREIYRTFAYVFVCEGDDGEVSSPLLYIPGRGSLPTARRLNSILLRGQSYVRLTSTYESSKRNPQKKFWKFSKAEVWHNGVVSEDTIAALKAARSNAGTFMEQVCRAAPPETEEVEDE